VLYILIDLKQQEWLYMELERSNNPIMQV